MERLQKVIAGYGYASRREAEKLILAKKVKVNGELITELGTKVCTKDVISINGAVINSEKVLKYYLLYKPRSVISASSDNLGRTCVVDLINTNDRIYPVGRLDYDTTGLILLTNDGEFMNYLTHPKNEVSKTYVAKLDGVIDAKSVEALKRGVVVDDRRVALTHFKVRKKDSYKNTTLIEITISEGRNHIVKRLFETLGYEVTKLTRTKYDFLTLDNMKSGMYRELSIKEVRTLMKHKNDL